MSETTIKLCEEADAILLGACGLPSVRYPDNTEIMPQVELRFIFDLYAGVRPARLVPGVPSPIVGAQEKGIDFVLIRESTEGLFASMGKGVTTHDEARETLVVTRKTTERLFDFSLKLAERRKKRGHPGRLTLVDKANVFKAFNWQRDIFAERKTKFPDVKTDLLYVDACAAMMVKKPWDFDVMVMENMFGDILSDLAAGLIGGLGIAPSADIGDKHAVFQPCHGTAPDIMGQGKANPTAMILSAAMMLDWLADKHDHQPAADAAQRIERAVDKAYSDGIRADGIRRQEIGTAGSIAKADARTGARLIRRQAMLFSVFTLDNPHAADKRKAVHGAHVAHLKNAKDYGVTITVGGPLVSDDGASAIGSLMVWKPRSIRGEKFNRADPFHRTAWERSKSAFRPQGVNVMLYIVHCIDRKDALAKRKQLYEEHRAYIGTASSKRIAVVMSGPLVHENNDSAGSCYLMEAPDIATVKAFNAGDPFTVNGVFETVQIHQYLRRAP